MLMLIFFVANIRHQHVANTIDIKKFFDIKKNFSLFEKIIEFLAMFDVPTL